MKQLLLLLPILVSCLPLPESPKDTPVYKPVIYDPLSLQAWHLENTAQNAFSESGGIAGQDHKIKDAHALGFTGKNIRIAVSDDGVQINHPDLAINSLNGEHRDYVNGSSGNGYLGNPTPRDAVLDAHGTAVTGLIAAEKGNKIGSFGVAPDAQFAGFNFLSLKSDMTWAHYYHQYTGPFKIFNYSWGSVEGYISAPVNSTVESSLQYGVTTQKSIYVKAAGNGYITSAEDVSLDEVVTVFGNANHDSEQTLPYYILVGAINARGKRSSYSTPGSNIWISGAGGEFGVESPAMVTTDLTGCNFGYASKVYALTTFEQGSEENPNCDYTNTMNGTSSAAPVISGIVALMLEAKPQLTWRDVKHILAKTADRVDYSESNNDLNHPNLSLNLPGHTYDKKWVKNAANNYFSNWYGFGRANALQAVLMANSYSLTTLGNYIEGSKISTSVNQTIPNNSPTGYSSTINVSSPVTKIESVQVEVTLNHPRVGDIGIELTSPSLTTSKLLLINSNAVDDDPSSSRVIQLLSNAFYEENPNGNWTIKVIDGQAKDVGTFINWSIKVNGH